MVNVHAFLLATGGIHKTPSSISLRECLARLECRGFSCTHLKKKSEGCFCAFPGEKWGQRPDFLSCLSPSLMGRKSPLGGRARRLLFPFLLFSFGGCVLSLRTTQWRGDALLAWGGFQGPSERQVNALLCKSAQPFCMKSSPEIILANYAWPLLGKVWRTALASAALAALWCAYSARQLRPEILFAIRRNLSLLSSRGGWFRCWSARFLEKSLWTAVFLRIDLGFQAFFMRVNINILDEINYIELPYQKCISNENVSLELSVY